VDNHGIRYYDPEVGRYISRDPVGYKDGMNAYLYVGDNPINHIDPQGLSLADDGKAVIQVVAQAFIGFGEVMFAGGPLPGAEPQTQKQADARNFGRVAGGATAATMTIDGGITTWVGTKAVVTGLTAAPETEGTSLVASGVGVVVDVVGVAETKVGVAGLNAYRNCLNDPTKINGTSGANQPKVDNPENKGKGSEVADVAKSGTAEGERSGKNFTKAGKRQVVQENSNTHEGQTTCEKCGTETVPGTQSKKGVTPPSNETHVDHIIPKSKGGDGAPSNGQVLCRDCNLKKSDN